ncbi:MAG: S1C family serine protease [Acidimicrobiales bacterium]
MPGRAGSENPQPNSDADSWVAQWSSLFDDEPQPGPTAQPPTREMPVYQAEQPPVTEPKRPLDFPGHRGPAAPGNRKPQRAEGDAAEIAAWQKSQERTKRRAKLRANQRKAQEIQRQRPGSSDIRVTESITGRSAGGPGPDRRLALIGGGALLIATVAVIGYLFTGFGIGSPDDDDTATGSVRSVSSATDDLNVGADVGPRGIQELALSTVQLIGLNDDMQPECAGSGVIVRSDGTILTNAHVVTSEGECEFSTIGVAVTVDSTSPAILQYRAVVLAVDPAVDLAVLRIVAVLDEDSGVELPSSFPEAPLGDSDTVDLGDDLRILGYPVIGGETITLTTGSVSGFSAQAGLGTRALMKTDASISAGNSGGMAVDSAGRVVGIPTKARASESGPAIDCRPLADTNSDGEVDEDDNCVPVGGFLNGVRPINLALALLGTAVNAEPIGAVVRPETPASDFDFAGVEIDNPRFALGRDGNTPVNEVVTAEAGIAELCFFVDWSGIPAGTSWDGVWFINGELERNMGSTDQIWTVEEEGRNFWLCAQEKSEVGLPAGVYEIGFFLDGMLLFAEGIELTAEPVEVVTVTWSNDTEGEICALAVNPFSESGQVGLNELADGDVISPGESRTLELPLGTVVVEAYNCEAEPVADNFGGLAITEAATFLIGL